MFSIVKVARGQTNPGSLLARLRGQLDERPWERGCHEVITPPTKVWTYFEFNIPEEIGFQELQNFWVAKKLKSRKVFNKLGSNFSKLLIILHPFKIQN